MILVSACLVGVNCRYDGGNNAQPKLVKRLATGYLLPICPEQLGGLCTPRIPAEILGGTGEDLWKRYSKNLEIIESCGGDNFDSHNVSLSLEDDNFPHSSIQVINQAGRNVTAQFLRGALEAIRLARSADVGWAILKARSPSCGYGSIYDGTFNHRLINGDGVTAALLKQAGIRILTDEQVTSELLDKLINGSNLLYK